MESALLNAPATPRAKQLCSLISRRPVVLYGAGTLGVCVHAALSAEGIAPLAFLDERKSVDGAKECGIPVLHPWHGNMIVHKPDAVVAISVLNPGVDVGALEEKLRAAGWGEVINPVELLVALGRESQLHSYWLTHPDRYDEYASEIAATEALLADEGSRDLYRRSWRVRRYGDFSAFPAPTPKDFYLPADLPPLPPRVRMIDCGAYIGDTVDDLSRKGVDFAEIVAFEPDPRNFARLAVRAAHYAKNGVRMTLFPCGLSERLETLRFTPTGQSSSKLDPQGEASVTCVAIDEVLPEFEATFIKMDIEGAEAEALNGAARMIARHKPRLAISAYHRPDDLWRLPRLVKAIRPDYRLHLRSHAYSGFETVLYAI